MTHVDLGDGIEVDVRNRLGFSEMLTVIRAITNACTDEEKGEVHFDVFDYAAKAFICSAYCGIPAPEDPETGYAAICGADRMYELIADYIDDDQLNVIWASARERLTGKRELFNTAAAEMTLNMLQKVNELYEMIGNVTEHFNGDEAIDAIRRLATLTEGK